QRNAERQSILKSIAQYQARIEHLPVREQEMASVTRDYEMAKLNYRSLLDKKMAAGMATDMERRQQAERFTLLDPARVPEKPVKPNRPALYTGGGVLSLALAIGFVFLRDFNRNAVLGEWELPEDIVVVGRVPFIEIEDQKSGVNLRRSVMVSACALVTLAATAGAYLFWRGV